ncbi:MAG: nitrilase-related carbon-nitrogen hydrolase [Planctomycetota bacterium]
MRLALIQQAVTDDHEATIRRAVQCVETAASHGAEVVCFPELSFTPFYPQRPAQANFRDLAEPVPGPRTELFCELAARHSLVIVINLFERDGDACYDCSPVIDSGGTLLGRTRMLHIVESPCFHEQGYYTPGDTGAPVFTTRYGRIGVAICYDRHFPEYMRALALKGAELVLVPQAGAVNEWPEGTVEAELRTAAFQNGYFAALCNRVGREETLTFAGESFVCAPDGRLLARAGAQNEILFADLDLAEIPNSHARRHFLADRRPELYAEFVARVL